MTHGVLTPLGIQLRSVLATLRPRVRASKVACSSLPIHQRVQSRQRNAFLVQPHRAVATAASLIIDEPASTISHSADSEERRGYTAVLEQPRSDSTLQWLNMGSHHESSYGYAKNEKSSDSAILGDILARYKSNRIATESVASADWTSTTILSEHDVAFLGARGYHLEDVQAWAHITSMPDCLEAATAIAQRISTYGTNSVPLFVLLDVLRREYISARALRILAHQTRIILEHSRGQSGKNIVSEKQIFLTFARLIRHAREVWPAFLQDSADMLVSNLPNRIATSGSFQESGLERLTLMLNKAMRLIAIPAAVEPFKSNRFQEAAIVRILRFMSEHDPVLQINREGYRAVIAVQLAQKKSENDKTWAELKALSWPPWKEDRTAMDSDITHEEHGVSKASETLRQMQEAGYGLGQWERTAAIYAGWDTDGTPTIQIRTLLRTDGRRFESGTATWVARIDATRTAQEAWACYLACEDSGSPPDQDILLAIFRKLHKEEQRLQARTQKSAAKLAYRRSRLWPGDAQEIQPLPPSTHLYTYTRTPPPSVDAFYKILRARGIYLGEHCLAFLVSNARSLKSGLEILIEHVDEYPSIQGMLSLEPTLAKVPMPVFSACIHLLSRFSQLRISTALPPEMQSSTAANVLAMHNNVNLDYNLDYCLLYAIALLRLRHPPFMPPWNSVLRAIGHESSLANLNTVFKDGKDDLTALQDLPPELQKWTNAIKALRLSRAVYTNMQYSHLDLDTDGFLAMCSTLQNAAFGSWRILHEHQMLLQNQEKCHGSLSGQPKELPWYVIHARTTLNTRVHAVRLRDQFQILVGDAETSDTDDSTNEPTHSLEIPSPAVLHAYVRANGWMKSSNTLVKFAHWLIKHKVEVIERCSLDRGGEEMMRRVLVALRVFLEVSWLSAEDREYRWDIVDPQIRAKMGLIPHRLMIPVPEKTLDEVRELVESVEEWGGWPSEEEVEEYCEDWRFQQLRGCSNGVKA